MIRDSKPLKAFLSMPSARRATTSRTSSRTFTSYFYPRPPRGGRRPLASPIRSPVYSFLSTPSARRATDAGGDTCKDLQDFYPRPPRGGRLKELHRKLEEEQFLSTPSVRRATGSYREGDTNITQFLSTPSARRATRGSRHVRCKEQISIHALREEGDAVRPPFFASCF